MYTHELRNTYDKMLKSFDYSLENYMGKYRNEGDIMRKEILTRVSRRTYLDKYIDEGKIHKIEELIAEINRVSGLTMEFVKDGAAGFKSGLPAYGLFKGVRSVILMKAPSDTEDLAEKIGYYGEDLVLSLTGLGLGTCWVAGTYNKSKFNIKKDEDLICVVTVGEVGDITLKEKLIRMGISEKRKPVTARLKGDPAPKLVEEAIEAVRLAPSARNSQKPVFTFKNGELTASVEVKTMVDLIDLGIAKCHAVQILGGIFRWGNGGKHIRGLR